MVEGTKKAAERERTQLVREPDTGALVEPARLTVGAFLDRWLKDYVSTRIEQPRTRRNGETILRRHLAPT